MRTIDDDGAVCIVSEDCGQTNCQNYTVPAPGSSASYTININQGNACGGSVTFTIFATGSFPGLGNDQICNAINLGTSLITATPFDSSMVVACQVDSFAHFDLVATVAGGSMSVRF